MAINLSTGAIAMICNIDEPKDDLKPFLQVFDIRLVNTVQNTNERYRMVLSDGVNLQQAMLATQMNHIIKSGKLQKGSIVQLREFICNLIQNRKIIIIINLEVIVEKCDPIGDPKPYVESTSSGVPAPLQPIISAPVQASSMDQPGMAPRNNHSYGGPSAGQNITGSKSEPAPNVQSYGSSFVGGPNLGRNASNGVPPYPKVEPGVGPQSGSYGNQPQNQGNYSTPGYAGGSRPLSNTYGRPAQSTYNQPAPMYMNKGPIAKNEAPARIIPIAALNPYQGRWTIKARVTAKGELRRYNNPKGEGKVFSFDLLDSDGGEIRVTCFNLVADQFYDQIEVGKVYLISKGNLKPAQKNFNHLNNEWEIHLESTSTIQLCVEEDNSIPKQQFNFRPISDIEGMECNSMGDIIGVVSSINPSSTIMRKNGTETHKRSLQLKDMSGRSVELTLWGNFANAEGQQLQDMCDSGVFPVLAVKAGRVNDFNGKTLGTITTSQLFINPDFPEAHRLKEWFDKEGKSTASLSISRDSSGMSRADIRKTVSQIKDEGLGRSEKPDWITVNATVSFIKTDNFCYTACTLDVGGRQCNKKVTNNGDGMWQCERCDQSLTKCDYRYLLQLQIQDHTGLTWVTAFQESGEEIMGISAEELYLLKTEKQDDVKFGEIVRKVLFTPYLFKLKVKEETYGDEQRVKSTVVKAEKLNFIQESKYLLSLMDKLSVEEPKGAPNAGYGATGSIRQGLHPMANNLGSTGNSDRYGASSARQVGQFNNSYSGVTGPSGPSIGGNGVYVLCNTCGSAGHAAQNCPRNMSGQMPQSMGGGGSYMGGGGGGSYGNRDSYNSSIGGGGGGGGGSVSGKCYKCNQSGHWARDCPGSNAVQSTYGGSVRMGGY